MSITEIQLFQILKNRIGEDEAKTLVEYVESKVEEEFERKKDVLATKQDVHNMIKWMFIFWIGQIGVIFGMLKVYFS
ncbi:MAG: hypothetical protein RJQ09_17775 [Cyclobacteriaceae bacterium]